MARTNRRGQATVLTREEVLRGARRRAASTWFRLRFRPPLLTRLRPAAAPDFVGVGAQRSGTSWWHGLIESHPQVHPLGWPFKELHFFDHIDAGELTADDIANYHDLFRRPSGKRCGEWTPRYMLDPSTPRLLHQAAPDAKLVVMLRDPVARFASGFAHALARGVSRDEAWSDALRRGRYHEQLVRVLEHFPAEQLLVLQFERCIADPNTMLDRTFQFLEIEPWRPDVGRQATNRGSDSRGVITPAERRQLRDAYESDVRALVERFPDIDLDLWRSP